ncbi:MAG: lipocalin-like domain-containing protein [Gemmatimonadota bacterium]|nr:lipocalin-like domain-containing protein [Gemmatimonadota bacterium]
MRRLVLAVIVALALMSAPAQGQQPMPRLVGTWRLIEFCNVDRPGDTTYSLGRHPVGFFMYDAAGNLSIQAMRAVPSGAFTQDSVPLRGMAELRASYFGYFGSYTITSDSTVVHHVRGGTIPTYIGTDQRRNFRFRGDTLSISGDEPWSCRQLVRER